MSKEALEGQSRCGEHSDTGALTLLWTDGPGLEIQAGGSSAAAENNLSMVGDGTAPAAKRRREEGEAASPWTPVYPEAGMHLKDCLIVNTAV